MEPTSGGTAAGIAGWKLIGGVAGLGAIGAGLAAIVVMCMTTPRDPKEWAVGLISTVVASIAGGSAVVQYLGIQHWASSHFGLVALLGLCFACGLPGWAVVRWTFNTIRRREGQGIDELLREMRDGGRNEA